MNKKLIVGISAPPSVDLLIGQLSYFTNQGYETYLLAPDDPRVRDYCKREKVPLIPVLIKRELSPFWDVITILQLIKIFLKHKPDIINLGTPKVSLLGMIAGYLTRVPLRIYTCRGLRYEREKGKLRTLLKFMEKLTAFCSNRIFCISRSLRDYGVSENIFKLHKTILIGHGSSNGVDLNNFSPKMVDKTLSKKIINKNQLEDKFVFGFVGRLSDVKGIGYLYEAFNKLSLIYEDIVMLVIGRPIWDHIKDPIIIDKMNNHSKIRMVGFQTIKDVPSFMSAMDCFVVPSLGEGFGNVYIQAAAMGLPIIGTKVTGCRDAVKDGFNGILVEPNCSRKLLNAMQEIIENKDLREEFSQNGIDWSKNFQPQIIWEGYLQLYDEPV